VNPSVNIILVDMNLVQSMDFGLKVGLVVAQLGKSLDVEKENMILSLLAIIIIFALTMVMSIQREKNPIQHVARHSKMQMKNANSIKDILLEKEPMLNGVAVVKLEKVLLLVLALHIEMLNGLKKKPNYTLLPEKSRILDFIEMKVILEHIPREPPLQVIIRRLCHMSCMKTLKEKELKRWKKLKMNPEFV
jgi:uncharacterized membrane protein